MVFTELPLFLLRILHYKTKSSILRMVVARLPGERQSFTEAATENPLEVVMDVEFTF